MLHRQGDEPCNDADFHGNPYGKLSNMVSLWSAWYHVIGTRPPCSNRASVFTSHSTVRVVMICLAAVPITPRVNVFTSGAGTAIRPPQKRQHGVSWRTSPLGQQPGSITEDP